MPADRERQNQLGLDVAQGSASVSGMVLVLLLTLTLAAAAFGWYREASRRATLERSLGDVSASLAATTATAESLRAENTGLTGKIGRASEQARQLAHQLRSVSWLAFELTLVDASQAVQSGHQSTKNMFTRLIAITADGVAYEMTNRDPQCEYAEDPPSIRSLRCEFVPRDGALRFQDVTAMDTLVALRFANPAALTAAGVPFESSSARLCVHVAINSARLDLGCTTSEHTQNGGQFNTREMFTGFSERYLRSLQKE